MRVRNLWRLGFANAAAALAASGGAWPATPGLAAGAHAAALPAAPTAHSARTQRVTDYARLSLDSANGNTLVERGRATGTLPGTVEVSLTLGERTATSRFTIHTKGGTIGGHGSGTLKAGKGGYESFGGWVVVTRGTGRFRHARGKGGLYGAIYRVTDALTVQVTGKLSY